jgi:hypothetical protein
MCFVAQAQETGDRPVMGREKHPSRQKGSGGKTMVARAYDFFALLQLLSS